MPLCRISSITSLKTPALQTEPTPTPTLTPLLLFRFSAADVSGTTVRQTGSETSIAGVLHGNATIASDRPSPTGGSYLSLAGGSTNDYMSMSASLTLPPNGMTFVMYVYVYPYSVTTWGRLFDFGNGAASDNLLLGFNNSQSQLAWSLYRGQTSATESSGVGSIPQNQWNLLCWTFSAPVDGKCTWTLYLNKLQVKRLTNVYYPNLVARSSCLIGKSNWSNDPAAKFLLDYFALFPGEMSAAELNDAFPL
eukprot:scaffold2099_cov252-Ochromonas_danica.AAC.2